MSNVKTALNERGKTDGIHEPNTRMRHSTRSQTKSKSSGTRSGTQFRESKTPPKQNPRPTAKRSTRGKASKADTGVPDPSPPPGVIQEHEALDPEDDPPVRAPTPIPEEEDDPPPPPPLNCSPNSTTPASGPLPRSNVLEALEVIRSYALTQEGEVNEITERVQKILERDFTFAWCGVIDAATREDPNEDDNLTLTRVRDKAAQSLSLSVGELSSVLPDAAAGEGLSLRHSPAKLPRWRPVSPLPDDLHDEEQEELPPIRGSSPLDVWQRSDGFEFPEGVTEDVDKENAEGDDTSIKEAHTRAHVSHRRKTVGSYAYERCDDAESDSGESDDYEKTEIEKRKKENRDRVSRGLTPLPSFGEDKDEDEDEDDGVEVDPPLRSSKRHYGNSKGPSQKVSTTTESESQANPVSSDGQATKSATTNASSRQAATADANEEEDEDGLSDPDEPIGKPGPVDAEVRAEAQRNYEEYEAKQRELAARSGKPLSAIFWAAGDSRKLLCSWNLWNVWQKWLVHEDGGKKEGEVPEAGEGQIAWMKRRWEEKRREVLAEDWQDKKKVQESFRWLIDWYEPLYQASALPVIQKGLSKRQMQSIAEDFNNNCRHANRNVGVCCFGFIVDLHGEHSVMFGAGQEFEDMRARSKTQLNQYLTDVVALFRISNVNLRLGSNENSDHRILAQNAAQIPLKSNKDAHRKFIPYVLRYDLSRIDSTYNWKSGKFIWREFADLAWKYRVRLVNWHVLVGVPGTTLKDLKTNIPAKILYEIGGARLKELQGHAEAYDEGKDEADIIVKTDKKALRLIEWTEEEKKLADEDQGEIAVVKGTNGQMLCRVKNSEKWVKAINQIGKGKGKSKGKQTARSSSSSSSSQSRVGSQSRRRSYSQSHAQPRAEARSASHSLTPKPGPLQYQHQTPTRGRSRTRSNLVDYPSSPIQEDRGQDTAKSPVPTTPVPTSPLPQPKYGITIVNRPTRAAETSRDHRRWEDQRKRAEWVADQLNEGSHNKSGEQKSRDRGLNRDDQGKDEHKKKKQRRV
ncbi:hypothetical protein K435DRAFT_792776 [Dendrothele bispora CBS 962.96]|uniref:Uncharacterized protein n=1 Tax=Dendrothele bispora (strain CBS 962.96) TaxID=1314807 RepID=A0A4S8MIS2_DENBC|nr:hypothetical protein K435DRAFT_792776 [Dendrothele bispora CBS 962.96]